MASIHRRGKRGIYHIFFRDENGKQKSQSLNSTDRKFAEEYLKEFEYKKTKKIVRAVYRHLNPISSRRISIIF